jgi:hypothetical protein
LAELLNVGVDENWLVLLLKIELFELIKSVVERMPDFSDVAIDKENNDKKGKQEDGILDDGDDDEIMEQVNVFQSRCLLNKSHDFIKMLLLR